MRRYVVKDTDEGLEVIEHDEDIEEVNANKIDETVDDALSDDEIQALKSLAAVAPKLIALVNTTDDDCNGQNNDLENEDDVDEISDEDEDEEVLDTDEIEAKTHDSKKSIGAIQKKSNTHDAVDVAEDIDAAWAKRYGG